MVGLIFRYNDTGYPAFGMGSRWSLIVIPAKAGIYAGSQKCMGEMKGYWSASPYAGNATNAWNVNFNNGNDNANNKSNNNSVRLVRGGEWRL